MDVFSIVFGFSRCILVCILEMLEYEIYQPWIGSRWLSSGFQADVSYWGWKFNTPTLFENKEKFRKLALFLTLFKLEKITNNHPKKPKKKIPNKTKKTTIQKTNNNQKTKQNQKKNPSNQKKSPKIGYCVFRRNSRLLVIFFCIQSYVWSYSTQKCPL